MAALIIAAAMLTTRGVIFLLLALCSAFAVAHRQSINAWLQSLLSYRCRSWSCQTSVAQDLLTCDGFPLLPLLRPPAALQPSPPAAAMLPSSWGMRCTGAPCDPPDQTSGLAVPRLPSLNSVRWHKCCRNSSLTEPLKARVQSGVALYTQVGFAAPSNTQSTHDTCPARIAKAVRNLLDTPVSLHTLAHTVRVLACTALSVPLLCQGRVTNLAFSGSVPMGTARTRAEADVMQDHAAALSGLDLPRTGPMLNMESPACVTPKLDQSTACTPHSS